MNAAHPTLNVLVLHSSARRERSTTRRLVETFLAALEDAGAHVSAKTRDLADGISFIDEEWVEANFAPPEKRTARQTAALARSEELIGELEKADVIVIGAPIYNFGLAAPLKAWIDLVARARRTFQYTENGPIGLLKGKRAVIVTASGGVAVGSEADFATKYLKYALSFIGIDKVDVIDATGQAFGADEALTRARAAIAPTAQSLTAAISQAA